MKEAYHAPSKADDTPFELPSRTYSSTILNGIGNGMMIGTAPFLAFETYYGITKKIVPSYLLVTSAIAMVVGAIWGGWSGSQEAQQIQDYRNALNNEITSLRSKTYANSSELHDWATRMRSETPATDKTR
jgi:hypothetical protein